MKQRFYIYILHETPIEPPYYTKIGYTHDPIGRLAQLQAGNARSLRPPASEQRPTAPFGFPVPTREHARALEARLFERMALEGVRLYGDLNHDRLTASRREWVGGMHPEQLWALVAREWSEYRTEFDLRGAPPP